jgi:O-antigen biosynthesis protein WbqP
MKQGTPETPTEELNQSEKYILWHGKFLRKFSLDELPQLLNIIQGKMSFIGPRPCMVNNEEIVKNLREEKGIHKLTPGITGWAQVNGRDLNSYEKKVSLDKYYLDNKSLFMDIKIIFLTCYVVLLRSNNIKH